MKIAQARKLAILTGGGDCPGLNAVIRAAVKTAHRYGWTAWGVRGAFEGLYEVDLVELTRERIRGILHVGGTILGSTNRWDPFAEPGRAERILENFANADFDALITIGGDGTQALAQRFFEMGLPVVGAPKTIDNDICATDFTFGFDTAVETATDAIDKLHPTAESHDRVMVVEVMGRHAGWIALHSGIAGGADVILIPEIPFDMARVCASIQRRYAHGRRFAIVVVAEGCRPVDGSFTAGEISEHVAQRIGELTGHDVRSLVLGHLQRGGSPTTFDRVLGSRYGASAARLAMSGRAGRMVALRGNEITSVLLSEAVERMRAVEPTSDTVQTARDLGICFGDEE